MTDQKHIPIDEIPEPDKSLLFAKTVRHKRYGWQGRPVKIVDGNLHINSGTPLNRWSPVNEWEFVE